MKNNDIKQILDGLTRRGVLSADGRRQMFSILLRQATEHDTAKKLLEEDITRLRSQRDALVKKNEELLSLVPKTKLAQLGK